MVKKPLCDCVVLAMGYKPEASLADQLESEDLEVQKIADGVRMSNAFVANTKGFDSVEEERAIALSIYIKIKDILCYLHKPFPRVEIQQAFQFEFCFKIIPICAGHSLIIQFERNIV